MFESASETKVHVPLINTNHSCFPWRCEMCGPPRETQQCACSQAHILDWTGEWPVGKHRGSACMHGWVAWGYYVELCTSSRLSLRASCPLPIEKLCEDKETGWWRVRADNKVMLTKPQCSCTVGPPSNTPGHDHEHTVTLARTLPPCSCVSNFTRSEGRWKRIALGVEVKNFTTKQQEAVLNF